LKIKVDEEMWKYLLKRDAHLTQLEEAGVDNWEGYRGLMDEEEESEEDDG
jgi:hypothetical protein